MKLNETILSEALEGLMDGVIFRPWHIRCRRGWGPPLPAVQAPVWWQTSRLGWTDRGASGWVTGHRDAPHPLCTLQCTETWWEKYECTEIHEIKTSLSEIFPKSACLSWATKTLKSTLTLKLNKSVNLTCTILSHIYNKVVDCSCFGHRFPAK